MIKTITKALFSAFISIVLISFVMAGWTSYAFITQSSKSSEIIKVVQDMYSNQKSVFIDVVNLSRILIKDTIESTNNQNNNELVETELQLDSGNNTQLEDASNSEDNGDNPLGIIIEQSLSTLNENSLAEKFDEPIVNDKNESSMNEVEIDLNS